MKSLRISVRVICTVFFVMMGRFRGASAQNINGGMGPRVAFYDCDVTSAATDTGNAYSSMQLVSHYLFQAIGSDTGTSHVILLSYANAGSDTIDNLLINGYAPSPDTSTIFGADYYIASSVAGMTGSYTLTVTLRDARSRAQIAQGTAAFSTSDTTSIRTACETASTSILPLIAVIRAYQVQVRNANPGLSVEPSINISLPENKVPLNGSVSVALQAVDFDGVGLPDRSITVSTSKGHLSSKNVWTDKSGNATVTYTPDSTSGIAVLSASIDTEVTVTNDTENVNKQAWLIVGDVPVSDSTQYFTSRLYELDFQASLKVTGYSDQVILGPTDLQWVQLEWAAVYSASGSVPGYGVTAPTPVGNIFSFYADTGAVWGKVFKTKFQHNVSIYDNDPCYDSDLMEAETYNGTVDTSLVMQSTVGYLSYIPANQPGDIYDFHGTIPWVYSGSDISWGEAAGVKDSNGNCNHGNANNYIYRVSGYAIDPEFDDTTSGASFTKVGDEFIISYTNVEILKDTSDIQSGISYQVLTTNYTGVLMPIQPLTSVKDGKTGAIPREYSLSQNFPNPFNPTTAINYRLPAVSNVSLKVYDVLGREVATLVDGRQNAGTYSVKFDGSRLATGVYFYRLKAGGYSAVRKLMLVK